MSMTKWATTILTLMFVGAMGTEIGCQGKQPDDPGVVPSKQPDAPGNALAVAEQQPAKEKEKAAEPKDQAKSNEPFKIQNLDVLSIRATKVQRDKPIAGPYAVDPDGKINLGLPYNNEASISVANLTLDEAKKRIEEILGKDFKDAHVELTPPVRTDRDFQMFEVEKMNLERKLQLHQRALAEGKSEAVVYEIMRITEKSPLATEVGVDKYYEVLKLRLKVIELQGRRIQKALDGDRPAVPKLDRLKNDFQALDEKCKQLREQISRWDDRMQELEMDLARLIWR
jgi:hypothetical protein